MLGITLCVQLGGDLAARHVVVQLSSNIAKQLGSARDTQVFVSCLISLTQTH